MHASAMCQKPYVHVLVCVFVRRWTWNDGRKSLVYKLARLYSTSAVFLAGMRHARPAGLAYTPCSLHREMVYLAG